MCALVLGDNQYGYERALTLLEQESFAVYDDSNITLVRGKKDIPLIHIGDNGDYYWGTELRDQKAWEVLPKLYDEMLVGNHEAAVLFDMPLGGYSQPTEECSNIIHENWESGKLRFATSHDGFLITHAGVHPSFEAALSEDPIEAAEFLNNLDHKHPMIQSIGGYRGGRDACGGILWRDVSENISDKWPQIFGHSRMPLVTAFGKEDSKHDPDYHYAIDVGYPDNGRIAAIYTDSKKVVEVNIND